MGDEFANEIEPFGSLFGPDGGLFNQVDRVFASALGGMFGAGISFRNETPSGSRAGFNRAANDGFAREIGESMICFPRVDLVPRITLDPLLTVSMTGRRHALRTAALCNNRVLSLA